ncbi:MAG: permease [Alphaproteobacteria bacterium]|nr:permease [Alphaproteobacteria bacterium]
MAVNLLLAALCIIALSYLVDLLRVAMRKSSWRPSIESILLGAVTNFFDTLGIGSFAPTTAWLKMRKLVPDSHIPATLNAGHCLPTVAEALIFIVLVRVNTALLSCCIGAAVAGSLIGASAVVRLPVRLVQSVVGVALLIAAALYAMSSLGLFPAGGTAVSLAPGFFVLAVAIHFILGALMTFGIGLFAPSLISLCLMGLSPTAVFPIMMGACAFLMPVSGFRFVRSERVDLRVVVGIALGGVPAVLVAAFIVTSLPLVTLRWGVIVVVLYAALLLLRSAMRGEARPAMLAAAGQQ